jgi:hypothetical protein
VATLVGSYAEGVELLLAAGLTVAALVAWTAWETTMASRLRRDHRPLVARSAAIAGAHRLTVVAQLGLVGVAAVVATTVAVPLWWSPVAVADPVVGAVVTAVLTLAAAATVMWVARRHSAPQDRRALLAVSATALGTEVVLRGLGLGLLDAAGWPVTVAVLVTAVATGLLQAWRSSPGNRAYALVLATVLGFLLGLVVVLTGSVLAAAAIHVVVGALGLARTLPVAAHAAGCACGGHDHDAPAPGPAAAAGDPGAAAMTAAGATGDTGAATAGPPTGAGTADHSSCGSTCEHAGTSACASCPLSAARV